MIQLNLFDFIEKKRRTKITPELVMKVTNAIKNNKKLNNEQLIKELNVARRTFYKIKKGEYKNLLEIAISDSVDVFNLEPTD